MFWVKAGGNQALSLGPHSGDFTPMLETLLSTVASVFGASVASEFGDTWSGPSSHLFLEPTPCQAHGPRVKNQVFLGSNPSLVI